MTSLAPSGARMARDLRLWAAGLFALAVVVRLAFVVAAPGRGGDTEGYLRTAENILTNFCVSWSDPATGVCLPHWGGNQLPGYPAFIAFTAWIAGLSPIAIGVAQALVAALALGRLTQAVWVYTRSSRATVAVGLVLALSPLQVAWPRMLITETIAIAATTWVLAELILSLSEGRLRVLPLAIGGAAALFIRYDSVLLAVPIALCAVRLHGLLGASRRGLVLAALIGLPLALWTARSISVGLPASPPAIYTPDGGRPAYGYLMWGATWSTDQYQRPRWVYPIHGRKYSRIHLFPSAYDSPAEETRLRELLRELARYDGQPMPRHLDDAFAELARERRARAPLRYWLVLPAARALDLWGNPYYSFGWPSELGPRRAEARKILIEGGLIAGSIEALRRYPRQILSKLVPGGYRYLLLVAFCAAIVLGLTSRGQPYGFLAHLALAYAATRTIFFALTYNSETRYIIEAIPFVETATAVLLALSCWPRGAIEALSARGGGSPPMN